jgi:hypothetical protein
MTSNVTCIARHHFWHLFQNMKTPLLSNLQNQQDDDKQWNYLLSSWAPILEHEKDDELGLLSLVTPKKTWWWQAIALLIVVFRHLFQIMKTTMNNYLSSSLGAFSGSWRWWWVVVCRHLWAPTPHHEDDSKQLLIVIFGRLLQIMKMIINNCSSLSLGASSPSWRWWWATIHCHLWVLALHHEDKMNNYSLSSLGAYFASWRWRRTITSHLQKLYDDDEQ